MSPIDLNPQIAFSVIDRVHSFYTGNDIDRDEAVDPATYSDELEHEPLADKNFLELETGIDDLEPDQQAALVALMWVGRGDFDASQWSRALALAKERWNARTGDYLISTPLVADYLDEALNQLGYSRE